MIAFIYIDMNIYCIWTEFVKQLNIILLRISFVAEKIVLIRNYSY